MGGSAASRGSTESERESRRRVSEDPAQVQQAKQSENPPEPKNSCSAGAVIDVYLARDPVRLLYGKIKRSLAMVQRGVLR